MKTGSERDSNGTPDACQALKRREKERWRVMEVEMAMRVGFRVGAGPVRERRGRGFGAAKIFSREKRRK